MSYQWKTRSGCYPYVLGVQALGILRTIRIHPDRGDITRSALDLNLGEKTWIMIQRILITDHVIVGVEHSIPSDVSNVRVVPGTVQAVPDVDQRARIPKVTKFDELGNIEIDARGRSGVS